MRKIKLFYASHVALAPRFTQTHTFQASLTEEYPQRGVRMSELGTSVLELRHITHWAKLK